MPLLCKHYDASCTHTVLQCVAVCRSALQRVAVCCNEPAMKRLRCIMHKHGMGTLVLQCVAVCCSLLAVLQSFECAAVCSLCFQSVEYVCTSFVDV